MHSKSVTILICFGFISFASVGSEPQMDNVTTIKNEDVRTTDAMPTTENVEILPSTPITASAAEANKMDMNNEQTTEQTIKLITTTHAITTTASSEARSNGTASTMAPISLGETSIQNKNDEKSIEIKENSGNGQNESDAQDKSSILMVSGNENVNADDDDEPTMKNANTERVTINDVTNSPTMLTTTTTDAVDESEESVETKSDIIDNTTKSSISKTTVASDRSGVVSKDDIDSIRGRALNITDGEMERQQTSSFVYVTPAMAKSMHTFGDDLSDVSMDNDGSNDFHTSSHVASSTTSTTTTASTPLIHDSECQSKKGCTLMSTDKTPSPPLFHNSGPMETTTPKTEHTSPTAIETTTSPINNESATAIPINGDHCAYNGKMYSIDEPIEVGCESICKCVPNIGLVDCQPRCPIMNDTTATHEQCVSVPDPKDSCCHIELCDVTLDDHEQSAIAILPPPDDFKNKNDDQTTVKNNEQTITTTTSKSISESHHNNADEEYDCEHDGKKYTIGMQFNEGCEQLCICTVEGVHCEKIECPSNFGLELMNPYCLEWAPEPATFRAVVPKCCPERMRCIDNGTCEYKGQQFDNWSDIPVNLTGCEQHCFCERGKVECRPACQPVPSKPPKRLKCSTQQTPKVIAIPDDDCCKHWACVDSVMDGETHTPSIDQTFMHKNPDESSNDDRKEDNGIHPLYPTNIQHPLNGVQVPIKTAKPTKSSTPPPPPKVEPPSKYDFDNYDDFEEEDDENNEENEDDGKKIGPGFFNPTSTKHQYNDYDQSIFNNENFHRLPPNQPKPQKPNQYNPFIIQHGDGKHELINILGGNLPPHVRIEHILQQIQGGNGGNANSQSQSPYGQSHQMQHGLNYPFGFGQHPSLHIPNEANQKVPIQPQAGFGIASDLQVIALEPISSRSVRVIFVVPQIFVGLHGRVELRYTKGTSNDTLNWQSQVFAPPEDLIATSQLEFELTNLQPSTDYRVKIILMLHDINSQPASKVYRVQTPADPVITPPTLIDYERTQPPAVGVGNIADVLKNIPDPELRDSEINSTWIRLSWRKLIEEELLYVDGIQIRYKEIGGIIFDATPLIHRTINTFTVENLKPETAYEFGLYYIPFPNHGAELRVGEVIQLRTAPLIDVYGFDVTVNVTKIKMSSVEVSWSGVPYPEDKYVNIYRTIVQSDSGKEDSSVFKVAKHDSSTATLITDLKPSGRYQLWIEMYLTNGKIMKSNVIDFTTKPGVLGKTGKLYSESQFNEAGMSGNYYGPLVIVSVIAAISLMSTLVLLLIVTKKRGHTASITPPRKTDVSYDNPSYKVEMQQETMNL